MTHFQSDYRRKKERYELPFESNINSYHQHIQQPSSFASNPNQTQILTPKKTPIIKNENIGKLVEGIDRKSMEAKLIKEKVNSRAIETRRSVQLNLMRLQDKQFELNKNIYNIAVGQIIDREAYLMNLNKEISQLKNKIKILQQEENETAFSRFIHVQDRQKSSKTVGPVLERSRTIQQRKNQCGRIYTRIKTPSSGRQVRFGYKNETSTYYKWKPKVDQNYSFEHESVNTDKFGQNGTQRALINREGKTKNSAVSKPLSNYRVKQKNLGRGMINEIECQTDDLIQFYEAKAGSKNEQNPQKAVQQQQIVELQPYSGIVFQKQIISEWQIIKIEDDFRQKIMKKLQIPKGFPLDPPEMGESFEDYQKLGPKIFDLFGVKIERQEKKVITRKFKNGLYFQLDAGKNIIWYYSGTFYFGDWEVDLPTESQKNGFGFEYVPSKYIYLGYFKDGMRHGKGTIKIFSTKIDNPDDFMAYDGDWANGKPHGFGRHIDEKNTKYIGDFKMGEKTGKAIILAKDGLYYQGEVKKNLKHGYGFQKLVNGDMYTGQFQDGKFGGVGTYKWKNGSLYQGQFLKGKRQGKGVWKGHNGDIFQGQYFQDIKNGWGKFTWANGQIYEGQFRNDIRHGQGTYRHPNGKVGKFMWIDGQIDHRIYSKEEEEYRCRKLKQAEAEQVEETPQQVE